jgi:hypothetical protein
MAPRDQRQVRPQTTLETLLAQAPVRNTGRFGRDGDPWNLLFIGSRDQLNAALKGAQWIPITCSIPLAIFYGLLELAQLKRLESFPPMNRYKVLGREQDQNWAQVVVPITKRHHFRLWGLDAQDSTGRQYWWGSANYDKDARYWDLSHIPDPDTDAERDYIGASLKDSPEVEEMSYAQCARIPHAGANDKGYEFTHDGRVLVVTLRPDDKPREAREDVEQEQ